jgi:hypothetical protein
VYLTYLDESDTKAKDSKWKVMGAVLLPSESFMMLEALSTFPIEGLVSEGQEFTEFHACELYGGHKPFDQIAQTKRLEAIEFLLTAIPNCGIKVAYGAVNLDHLKKQPYASANSLDVAFRLCAKGITRWLASQLVAKMFRGIVPDDSHMTLFIADDCDPKDKSTLQKSFRSMRTSFRIPPKEGEDTELSFVHDDMYFGDSRYSIGIQMADLCSYFIARHLSGDAKTESFYKMIEPHIISAAQEPR